MGKSVFNKVTALFTTTDEQSMWQVQAADDSAAFARLVHRWQGPIRRLCERMLGDAHRAEDVAQETFARLFARRKEYRAAGKFSTFLWRVALNLCYDELRRVRRRSEQPIDTDEPLAVERSLAAATLPPDDQLVLSERADAVRQALQELPDPYRAVLVLRHYENLKFREIADVLEIPEGTVKSRMAEALSQLSRLLRERTDFPSQPRSIRKESLIV